MDKKRKGLLVNILFICFIIFLFTPFGLPVRAKLTQGIMYAKGYIISPSTVESSQREDMPSYNISLHGIANAENINMNDLKGKVIFINHWATWCPPCRAEMPSLDKLYKDYKDKVAFLFITTDGKREVESYYKSKEFNFPTYNAISRIPEKINTNSLPASFILDKNGKIALEEFGPADWNNAKVRATLDNLIAE